MRSIIKYGIIGAVAFADLGCTSMEPAKETLAERVEIVSKENSVDVDLERYKLWRDIVIRWSRENKKSAIVINKKERKLNLYSNGLLVDSCRVGLGLNPYGAKVYDGDFRTPEGIYRINWKRDGERKKLRSRNFTNYHKALVLNYPTEEDHLRFLAARKNGEVPLDAKHPGKMIEIHGENRFGVGSGKDWTDGCVALNNYDIKRFFPKVNLGDKVAIIGYE